MLRNKPTVATLHIFLFVCTCYFIQKYSELYCKDSYLFLLLFIFLLNTVASSKDEEIIKPGWTIVTKLNKHNYMYNCPSTHTLKTNCVCNTKLPIYRFAYNLIMFSLILNQYITVSCNFDISHFAMYTAGYFVLVFLAVYICVLICVLYMNNEPNPFCRTTYKYEPKSTNGDEHAEIA